MGYKWIDCSNEEFLTFERHEVVLVIRSAQSSTAGVAFRRFSKSCQKEVWEALFLACHKIVSSVIKVSNVHQKEVPIDEPTYMGISFTRGNCPKSPRRIIEQPPNGIVHFKGKG